MEFRYEPSASDLLPYVVGFVERRDTERLGDALELPLLNPMLQFFIRGDYCVGAIGGTATVNPVPRAAVWGTSGVTLCGRHDQQLHVFVIILTNLGLTRVTGARPAEFTDRRTAFADLWPRQMELINRIDSAGSFLLRVQLASAWLRGLPSPPNTSDESFLSLADSVADERSLGTVRSIASQAGLSVRSLHRNFVKVIGRTPKEYLRIARLQRVVRQIHPHPWRRACRNDALLEYFDDSHFARDFAQLTTINPRQFCLAKRRTGDPLVNTVYGF